MKINKRKLQWNGISRPERRALTQYHWRSVMRTDNHKPQGKKSSTGDSPVSVRNRKKYTSHLLEEPRSAPATQPRKKGHYLELSLFANGLSFKTILPNLLLFSRKIRERNFLFFLVEFAPCLLLQLACPKWQFPCYSWVNPFLLEKSLFLRWTVLSNRNSSIHFWVRILIKLW